MIMMVVSRTTMSWAPAMMTRIHQWARRVAVSSTVAPLSWSAVMRRRAGWPYPEVPLRLPYRPS